MTTSDRLGSKRIYLAHGSGELPAVGFGTLIPDHLATKQATRAALEVGFRHLDCAERYRNEEAVGDAIQEAFKAGTVRREDCRYHQALEHQSSPGTGQACLRGELPAATTGLCRLLPHPYPLCLSTRRRAGPEGRTRPSDLRFRGYAGRDMAGDGAPCRRRPLQVDRPIRHYAGEAARDRCGPRVSSLPLCRSNRIDFCPNGSCSLSVGITGLHCRRLLHWDMPWSRAS